jgi:ABC-2 type transport system ATP-binding protein
MVRKQVTDNAAVIDVQDLLMRYGSNDVLKGVTFRADKGEVVALLGPNGAGKTTTIEILEGFRLRSAGDVSVLGKDPADGDELWRSRLGVVLQSWRDHSRWRVRELLDHFGRYYEPYVTADHKPFEVDELIDMVGLGEQRNQKIASLSGGQRRRMDVAVGIVGRPKVLFLDEPTVGFDPEARREFHDMIHRLSDLEDTTILLTTHDLDEAEKLSDRIVILAGGRIIADGSADQLARQVSNRAQVCWVRQGKKYVHATDEATAYVRKLLAQHDDIEDLEIRRASLEDTYMAMVHRHESGKIKATDEDINQFKGVQL